jgi:AraC family transcriptional regulator
MSTPQGAYGSRLGDAFGLRNPPTLITQTLRRGDLALTQLVLQGQGDVMTQALPKEDAFLIALMTNDCPDYEMWNDGRPTPVKPVVAGDVLFHNLQTSPIGLMRKGGDTLMLYLPRVAMDSIADDANANRIETLKVNPGVVVKDPVFAQLASLLIPLMQRPEETNGLLIDHLLHAFGAHVAQAYGGMRITAQRVRGGLAPWQERRAKELMVACIDTDVSLSQLAAECKLSINHFARAFRLSTGTAPHRWFMERRIDKAKELLRSANLPLTDVALASGFADQSHFTRIFTQFVGISPGAWRRLHLR